jgi:hypothetical protein
MVGAGSGDFLDGALVGAGSLTEARIIDQNQNSQWKQPQSLSNKLLVSDTLFMLQAHQGDRRHMAERRS